MFSVVNITTNYYKNLANLSKKELKEISTTNFQHPLISGGAPHRGTQSGTSAL